MVVVGGLWGGGRGGGVIPKIETNSRDEMGIQVKLNRGIQQEAKRGVTKVTGNSALRPIVALLKPHASRLYKNVSLLVRFPHTVTVTSPLSNL